jgi:hypothetical protein
VEKTKNISVKKCKPAAILQKAKSDMLATILIMEFAVKMKNPPAHKTQNVTHKPKIVKKQIN